MSEIKYQDLLASRFYECRYDNDDKTIKNLLKT